jgi:hypothetical protein
LFLGGDNATGKSLIELTTGPNDTFNFTIITTSVFEAVASTDQTQLLYATKDEILVRDLRTGGVKPLIKGAGYCLAWSPDGKRFSYKQASESHTKLYTSDLDGKAKLVWEDVFADNRNVNQATLHPAADTSRCAQWVAPDKLIFDRFGPSQKRGSGVKPNTTTLISLNDSVRKGIDTEKKWSVEGICKTGSAILRSRDQGEILIAKNLENLAIVNPSSGPCSSCRFVGFASQSCVPFFIEENSRDSSDLFYLNPTNWQRQRAAHIGQAFSPEAKMLISSSTRLMVVGDAPASLLLVDTESGDITQLSSKSDARSVGQLQSPVPVVWIEK